MMAEYTAKFASVAFVRQIPFYKVGYVVHVLALTLHFLVIIDQYPYMIVSYI